MPAEAVSPVFSKMRARISGAVGRDRDAAKIVGHIEIGFVKRERLDQRRVVSIDCVNFTRDRALGVEPRRDEHEVRAFAHRRARQHRRAHAKFARLIACGGHNASLRSVADSDRAPTPRGVIALLDRGVESVHVDMNDFLTPKGTHVKHSARRTTLLDRRRLTRRITDMSGLFRRRENIEKSREWMVEPDGIEPTTSSMPLKRSPN